MSRRFAKNRQDPFKHQQARLNVEALESRVTPSTATNTISGFVYYDANNNGAFDTGETPIANSQIVLINNSNNQIAGTTTTAADGSYSFTTDATVPGPEQNTATQTLTLGPTLTNFADTGTLPQFDPTLGTLDKVVITESGTIQSNIQAENTSPTADTIQGTVSGNFSLTAPGVSNDSLTVTGQTNSFSAAANPSADHSFSGPASVTWNDVSATSTTPNTITITDPSTLLNDYTGTGTVPVSEAGTATSSATDTTGNITTNIVSHGQATITVTYYYHSAGSIQTNTSYTVEQPNVPTGYIPGLNSKNGPVLPHNPTPPEQITDIIVTPQVPNAPNNNFGELKTTSISGVAYIQTTANEVFTQGTTPPLAGVTMTLTGGDLTTPLTTTTAQDGSYSFSSLDPGTYTVTQTQPTAYLPGTITAGTDGGTVGPETISNATLNAGDSATGYNFGELNQPSITGFVYVEPNAPQQTLYQDNTDTPGIAGVTVTLTGSDGSSQTTTTGQDGSYSFTPLKTGVTYSVAITHPTGYLVGTDTAGSAGGQASTSSEQITQVTLTGGTGATGYNFGEVLPASLAGNVYVDAQNDGQLDPGDPAIANVTLTLTGFSDQGPVSLTTKTASDGTYAFNNLRPGTYAITETQPTHYLEGATTVGTQGGTGATDNISDISLAPDTTGTSNNFGEVTPDTPGNPGPKDVGLEGLVPILSKTQLTGDPSLGNVSPTILAQLKFAVATQVALTGTQPNLVTVLSDVATLQAGGQSVLVNQLWTSSAHRVRQVDQAYQTVLGRAPTTQELSQSVAQLNTGTSQVQLMENLYVSPEYQQLHSSQTSLADALSQDILNVTPGSASTQSLVQSLGTEPLSTVVNTLMMSTASVSNLIDDTYLATVQRPATAAEIQAWTAPIQAGTMTLDQLAQRLLASQEFYTLASNVIQP